MVVVSTPGLYECTPAQPLFYALFSCRACSHFRFTARYLSLSLTPGASLTKVSSHFTLVGLEFIPTNRVAPFFPHNDRQGFCSLVNHFPPLSVLLDE